MIIEIVASILAVKFITPLKSAWFWWNTYSIRKSRNYLFESFKKIQKNQNMKKVGA
jgi:hypothetical protein